MLIWTCDTTTTTPELYPLSTSCQTPVDQVMLSTDDATSISNLSQQTDLITVLIIILLILTFIDFLRRVFFYVKT